MYKKKIGMTPEQALETFTSKHDSKLKILRVRKGYSQQGLADAAGIPKRAIQTYEQGERNVDHASLETLCDICIALNCTLEDILESEELLEKFHQVKW